MGSHDLNFERSIGTLMEENLVTVVFLACQETPVRWQWQWLVSPYSQISSLSSA